MAFKISKSDNARIMKLAGELDEMRTAINDKIDEWRGEMEDLLEFINAKREELRAVIEDVHSEKQGEFDDKSEKWLEGDRGMATEEWLNAIEDAMNPVYDDYTVEMPEELTFDSAFETLKDEGLPSEPEY